MSDYERYILDDLDEKKKLITDDPFFILERIRKYNFGILYHKEGGIRNQFDPSYYEYSHFIRELDKTEIAEILQNVSEQNKGIVYDYLVSYARSSDPIRFDVLLRLENDKTAFELIFDTCERLLKLPVDHGISDDAFLALARCINWEPWMQSNITEFFKHSYNNIIRYTAERGDSESLVNADLYLAITRAILLLPGSLLNELKEEVYEAYRFLGNDEMSYHGNQASGYMILMISEFGGQTLSNDIKRCIEVTGKHYQKNKFVYQNRYAYWYIKNEPNSALDFFKIQDIEYPVEYLVALFADLDYKEALPELQSRLELVEDPVKREVFLEGIQRLEQQIKKPDKCDRMVWFFESTSPTQRALGDENDSVFVKRAREKYDQDIDTAIYETDDE